MIEVQTKGYVKSKGGVMQFIISNKSNFMNQVIDNFADKEVLITVKEDFKGVTAKLRGYYFGPFLSELKAAFKQSGDIRTKTELDDKMRRLFLVKEEVNLANGEIEITPKSLSKEAAEVTNKELREYIGHVIRFTAEHLDYGIPYPGEF